MILNIDKYQIESDSLQFKVKEYIGMSEETEEEPSRKMYKNLGYFTKLESAIKFLPQEVIRDSETIEEVLQKLENIYLLIERLDV